MKIEKTALLALGAAMASGAALASNTVDKAIPNVLLILVDDLGLGDLSCQYAKDLSTPNIDRIFETGVRLDNFYANSSVSSPSRAVDRVCPGYGRSARSHTSLHRPKLGLFRSVCRHYARGTQEWWL